MDRTMLEQHLALAEEHVAQGEQHIAKQHDIIAKLQRGGHDTTEAESLLQRFEELQVMHVTDRDRLKDQLD